MSYVLNPTNDRIRDYLNVTEWHERGVLGNLKVGTAEKVITVPPLRSKEDDYHAYCTTICALEIAPMVELLEIDFSDTSAKHITETVDEILEKNIVSMFRSECTYTDDPLRNAKYDEELSRLPNHFLIFNGTGNEGAEKYARSIVEDKILGIGACYFRDGEAVPTFYSSESLHTDFTCIIGLEINNSKFGGTSEATPIADMLSILIQERALKDTGRFLTGDELYSFILDNVQDISDKGKDEKTGWGDFTLPKYDDVDWSNYMEEKQYPTDLSEWAKKGYDYVIEKGISDGARPKDTVTREELWTMIERLKNE